MEFLAFSIVIMAYGTQVASTSRCCRGYGIEISMDGKGRCLDNIIVERIWRTLKYEWVFLHGYATHDELEDGLRQFTAYFNGMRLHEGLGYQTPDEVYKNGCFPNITEKQIAIEETSWYSLFLQLWSS